MTQLFGIKNCDTVKKSLKWLKDRNVSIEFNDFKKQPPTLEQLTKWNKTLGWETLLNRRGTTWRKLPEEIKTTITEESALAIMLDQPSIIKRPILEHNDQVSCGFQPEYWETLLSTSI